MKFSTPALVEQVVWELRQADQPRGYRRYLIDRLFNGQPPLLPEEQSADPDATNVNFLKAPILAADARRSYYNGFIKPGVFFNATLDSGDRLKREEWGHLFTNTINRYMKRSREYFEFMRSQFALTVLHGIGPGFWTDHDGWVPECLGIEDVLIPGRTLLSMKNLDHFAIYRQYTAMQLYNMTHGHKVDPAWNMPVVEAALSWVREQTQSQLSYTDTFMPQKVEERIKEDMGILGTDVSPTVDAWDFYYYSDEGKQQGWRRCMILETPADVDSNGRPRSSRMPSKNKIGLELGKNGNWLYRPDERKRIYASKLDEILHFQFADLNATAPFRYHSTRSLGWLLYSVCHLDNRLRCRVMDAMFEHFLQYFRLSNPSDHERITKIDLHDKGVIPEGVELVRPEERWKIDYNLVTLGLSENQRMITDAASQYRENPHGASGSDRDRVTATEVMADVNKANALVGSMLLQAYTYAKFQYQEIVRRFCRKNSKDADVRAFRAEVLQAGVPEDMLAAERWNIEPERVLGAGNKVLQIAIADKLMAIRPNLDPQSQREVDHIYVLANSDDPDMANRLVPVDSPRKSDSIRDAQIMVGSLMQGIPVQSSKRDNPSEMIETLLRSMAAIISRIQRSGPPTPEDIAGLGNIAATVSQYIAQLGQNKSESEKVKTYTDQLRKVVMILKKLQAAIPQPDQGGNGGMDPKDKAKIAGTVIQAQAKAKLAAESHAQRTQQRDVQFRMQLQQKQEQHAQDMRAKAEQSRLDAMTQMHKTRVDIAAKDIETAGNVRRNKIKSLEE